ncbi:toprim domain-containing protein [Accumulibacter sp.]|uniref:toprim domain-containing protein n=1 Tax=Accumulibacter sp. TaxID=2053492 RepID=UPI001A49CB0E|nr:toprim domain-containing protein [Accumulibacter sp.]MBL8373794.1 toprim domain-containing protein [Accumulibacter sp.]
MTSASGFIAALQAAGLAMHREADLVPDGSLHRYRVDGDKAGSLNGWYVLDLTEPVHAAFGSWKTGQSCTWRPDQAAPMTDAEREALARRREAARAARDSEQAAVRAAARLRAEKLWSRAKPATNEHAYLVGKSVGAFGIRDLRGQLVIPLRDGKGALHTLQFIGADGRKTFLTGGRKQGCYFSIGAPGRVLCICEGYATGATIYQCTRHATAIAFDAGNIAPVARALRAKFPDLVLCICADNDADTPGNPGLTAARQAAVAVGAVLAVPEFGSSNG